MNPFIRFILLYLSSAIVISISLWMSTIPLYGDVWNVSHKEMFWDAMKAFNLFAYCMAVSISTFLLPYTFLWMEVYEFGHIEASRYENIILISALTVSFIVMPIGFLFLDDFPQNLRESLIYGLFFNWLIHASINSYYLYRLKNSIIRFHNR